MAEKPQKEGVIDEVVEDLMEDPDAPEKGNAVPSPQTIANEPSGGARKA